MGERPRCGTELPFAAVARFGWRNVSRTKASRSHRRKEGAKLDPR